MGDLNSLTVPLWIMAAVSMLQALLLIGMGVAGYLVYSRVMTLVTDLEARQIAPIREKASIRFFSMKQKRYASGFGVTFSPAPSAPLAVNRGGSKRRAWTFFR